MKKYLNHLEQMYDEKTFKRKVEYIKFNFSDILQNIDSKTANILEVGPGMGECISYLNEIGIDSIDVVDNDREVLDHLKKNFKVNKVFLNGNISAIDKQLKEYDLIVMIQVFEHLPVNIYREVIKTLYRHLKKGGYIIVVVPNGNNPLGIVERYGDLQHYNCFTEQSLKDLLNLAEIQNFTFIIRGYEIPSYSVINAIRKFLQKVLHSFLLLLLIINGGIFFKTMTPNIMLLIKK